MPRPSHVTPILSYLIVSTCYICQLSQNTKRKSISQTAIFSHTIIYIVIISQILTLSPTPQLTPLSQHVRAAAVKPA